MGGRLINFYADDLVDLLLDDFLAETAQNLQEIENDCRQGYKGQEARGLAENLMKAIVDYQSEENLLEMKYTNPAYKKDLKPLGLKGMMNEPKPIYFNLNEKEEMEERK
eukprot:CAMPEP_0170566396 /NCGR_PEP_ID=MMETSP0211-20121228/79812_1 /TAXON_ID=311385 /ORGANISM="Pseudokeronopsis sp., Strain OXSARD2" /LENGTH=108 /DNA_ID=CAMNT_0010887555 /DNA_START=512 /DNA_END=838 /DNA_ORIENTATION=+